MLFRSSGFPLLICRVILVEIHDYNGVVVADILVSVPPIARNDEWPRLAFREDMPLSLPVESHNTNFKCSTGNKKLIILSLVAVPSRNCLGWYDDHIDIDIFGAKYVRIEQSPIITMDSHVSSQFGEL